MTCDKAGIQRLRWRTLRRTRNTVENEAEMIDGHEKTERSSCAVMAKRAFSAPVVQTSFAFITLWALSILWLSTRACPSGGSTVATTSFLRGLGLDDSTRAPPTNRAPFNASALLGSTHLVMIIVSMELSALHPLVLHRLW